MKPSLLRLTAILNRLFPERLELGFGVEVTHMDKTFIVTHAEPNDGYVHVVDKEDPIKHYSFAYGAVRSLGRPIELAEVLRAFRKRQGGRVWCHLYVEDDGRLWLQDIDEKYVDTKKVIAAIDLSLPVSRWDDATLDAVAGMIETKE